MPDFAADMRIAAFVTEAALDPQGRLNFLSPRMSLPRAIRLCIGENIRTTVPTIQRRLYRGDS